MPLQKRPTGWYCRVVIPSYIGEGEIVRSLRTKSRPEALRRWHDIEVAIRCALETEPMTDRVALKKLVDRLADIAVEHSAERIRIAGGKPVKIDPARTYADAVARRFGQTDKDKGLAVVVGPSLTDAVTKYVAAKTAQGAWTPKTRGLIQTFLDEFVDLLGDKPAASVTKADLLAYQEAIAQLPAHAVKRLPGLTPSQAIAEGKRRGLPLLAPKSVNIRLDRVRSFFNWLQEVDVVESSPAKVLKDVPERGKRQQRSDLTDTDVRAFVAACAADATQPAHRWVPALLAYSGARLEEIAQLRTKDVVEVEGIWCLRISDDEGRRLKTEASRRTIPVHPELIRSGFLEYAQGLPAGPLWPELKANKSGVLSSALSKWLNARMKATTTGDGKVVHSLRHTVATKLTNAAQEQHLVEALLGHSSPSITMNRYSKGASPTALLAVVEHLAY